MNRPLVRPDKAGDQVDQGGLAGTVGSDDPHQFTGLHLKGDVLHGLNPAEALGKVGNASGWGRSFGFHLYPAFKLVILALDVMEDPLRQGHDEHGQEEAVNDDAQAAETAQGFGKRDQDKGPQKRAGHGAHAPHHRRGDGQDRIVQGKDRHAHEHVEVGHEGPGEGAHRSGEEQGLGLEPVDVDPGAHHRAVVVADALQDQTVIGIQQTPEAEETDPGGGQGEIELQPRWGRGAIR